MSNRMRKVENLECETKTKQKKNKQRIIIYLGKNKSIKNLKRKLTKNMCVIEKKKLKREKYSKIKKKKKLHKRKI